MKGKENYMKKTILKLAMTSMLLLSLSSCNKTIFDTTYSYEKIHLYATNKCYKIKEWNDYSGEQIQVKLTNGTVILTSAQNAMLIKGDCPVCDHI